MTESEQLLDNLYKEARVAFGGGDWARAEELLRRVIRKNPKYPGAQDLLRDIPKRQSVQQSAQIEYDIGLGYFEEGDWSRAIEGFDAALRADPNHHDATAKLKEARRQVDIAQCLSEADKHRRNLEWQQAVSALRKALDLNPDSAEVRRQLDDAEIEHFYQVGERHRKAKRWQAAFDLFERLEQRRPGYRDVPLKLKEAEKQSRLQNLYHQAQQHEQATEWSRAKDLYEYIRSEAPDYRDVGRRLSRCTKQLDKQKVKSQEGKEQEGNKQNEGSRAGKSRSNKGKRILSSKWSHFCFFAGGCILVALFVFRRAQDVHCLLIYRTTGDFIDLIILLISLIAGGLASFLPPVSPDIRRALRCLLGGAALALLCFMLWIKLFSLPPSREECYSKTPAVTLVPIAPTGILTSCPASIMTLTYVPTLTLTSSSALTYTETATPSLTLTLTTDTPMTISPPRPRPTPTPTSILTLTPTLIPTSKPKPPRTPTLTVTPTLTLTLMPTTPPPPSPKPTRPKPP